MTKVHLRAEGHGKPMTGVLTPGQRHEATVFERLLEQAAVRRPGPGRPRLRPRRVVGDKGSTGQARRSYCRRRGIRYTIPRRRDERHRGRFDRASYRLRNRVDSAKHSSNPDKGAVGPPAADRPEQLTCPVDQSLAPMSVL